MFFSLAFSHQLPAFLFAYVSLSLLLLLFYLRNLLAVSSEWIQIHNSPASASQIEEITLCTTTLLFSYHLFLEPNCTQCSDKAPLSGPVWGATSTLLGAFYPPLR